MSTTSASTTNTEYYIIVKKENGKFNIEDTFPTTLDGRAPTAIITEPGNTNVVYFPIKVKQYKTVENEYFEDFIVLQARVEPLNSILVNIIEGGAVQEIYVENGWH